MKTEITGPLLDSKGLQPFVNEDEGWSQTDNLLIIYNNQSQLWDVVDLREELKKVIASINFWEEFLETYQKVNGKPFIETSPKSLVNEGLGADIA